MRLQMLALPMPTDRVLSDRHTLAIRSPPSLPLFARDTGKQKNHTDASATHTWSTGRSVTCCLLCCVTSLWVGAFITVGILYTQANSMFASMSMAATPYVTNALNHTMSILDHVDTSASDVVQLTQATVPALRGAMEQATQIVGRLESLAAHPVLRMTIGEDTQR